MPLPRQRRSCGSSDLPAWYAPADRALELRISGLRFRVEGKKQSCLELGWSVWFGV